ncbi:diaminopimelate epimerase, partial [Streptomyces sp. W16]|nr:diaminopimelate epimerase [Streptomyces sp. W16]
VRWRFTAMGTVRTDPAVTGTRATYTVDVPGGTLVITEWPDGRIEMTGPAVIVAEGEIDADWLENAIR